MLTLLLVAGGLTTGYLAGRARPASRAYSWAWRQIDYRRVTRTSWRWWAAQPVLACEIAGLLAARTRGVAVPIRPENRARYPQDWPEISARIRFGRADSRCECAGECGRGTHDGRCPNVHGQPAYATGSRVILTTAHLDHTPENCDPANLRAMCQGCHLHYDRQHHAETRAATRRAAVAAAGQLELAEP